MTAHGSETVEFPSESREPHDLAARLRLEPWASLSASVRSAIEATATLELAGSHHTALRARAELVAERIDDPDTRARILRHIAAWRRAAPRIAHRDLKPANAIALDSFEIVRLIMENEDDAHAWTHPKPLSTTRAREELRAVLDEVREARRGKLRTKAS